MFLVRLFVQYLVYAGLLVLFLVLFYWSYFSTLLDLTTERLMALIVAVITAFVVYFDRRLNSLVKQPASIENRKLSEAVKKVFDSIKSAKEIRIYAFTTEQIFPLIRESDFKVGSIKVLLHDFDPSSKMKHAGNLGERVKHFQERWEGLSSEKHVGESEVRFYDEIPTHYIISIDNKFLIQGFYLPQDESEFGNDYVSPSVLSAENVEEIKLVQKVNSWFDRLWEYNNGQ
jgi:hypothetical protein